MATCFLKDGNWEIKGGVFIHSSPQTSDLYDIMWNPTGEDSFDEYNIDDTFWNESQ